MPVRTVQITALLFLVLSCLFSSLAHSTVLHGFQGDFQSELRSTGTGISVAVADVNNDGKLDLVVATEGGVDIHLANGDGTFQTPVSYPAGDFTFAVAVGDLNGDGKPDVAIANFNLHNLTNGNTVSVLVGNGDGTFQPAVNYAVGGHAVALVIADFNADSKNDIAVANNSDGTVSVLLGNGNGTFQPSVVYPAGDGPHSIAAADFNGDGKLDLAIGNCPIQVSGGTVFDCDPGTSGLVQILVGNGDGTFQNPVSVSVVTNPNSLALADLNGDGNVDIVVTHKMRSGSLGLLFGQGNGTFAREVLIPAMSFVSSTTIGDFNGDGKLDIVSGGINQIGENIGNGDGTFQPTVNYTNSDKSSLVATGDFNNDGRPDIVRLSDVTSVFLNAGGIPRQATTISLSSSLNPSHTLGGPTITATLTSPATAAGTVTFIIDGETIFSVDGLPVGAVDSFGNSVLNVNRSLTAGAHTIIGVYSGDTNTLASISSPLTQTVNLTPSEVGIGSSANPSFVGANITLSAGIATGGLAADIPIATGTVTFFEGSTVLGVAQVQPGAMNHPSATFDTSSLSEGTHSITASYSGDVIYAPSTAPPLQQVVVVVPDFSLGSANGSSVTIRSGQTATYNLQVSPANGFIGVMTVACSNAPVNATCVINPASFDLSSPTNVAVSIATSSPNGAGFGSYHVWPNTQHSSILIFTMVSLCLIIFNRRACARVASSVVLAVIIMVLPGCGGNTTGGGVKTPPGNYTVVVTASSGSISHSMNLLLVVQ